MKKVILSIFAIAFILQFSKAQSGFLFGLKGGANYSNEYDSKTSDFTSTSKFGFAGGAFFAIPIGKYLGIQPEVLFSQKGFKAEGKVLGSPYDLTRTTNYIDVPLLLTIKPIEYVSIVVGPQYSYLIKQKDVFSNNVFSTEQTKEFDNENLRKNVLGFIGGVDINVKNLVIGLRAGWDVQNNNGDGTTTTPRYKNAWTQATVGFRLY
jgi:Outer membrane protein beta-barrel domain